METNLSNPLQCGGFFVGRFSGAVRDGRSAILVNGNAYRRSMAARSEPTASAWQTLASSLALAAFVVGGVLFLAGVQ